MGADSFAPGDVLHLFTYALHRSPAIWDAPDTFDPSRWTDRRDRPTPDYIPFAAGPSTCPGRSVALRVLVAATAAFTSLYRVSCHPQGSPDPLVYVLFSPPDSELRLIPRDKVSRTA